MATACLSPGAVRCGRRASDPVRNMLRGVTDLRVAIIGYGLAGRVFHAPLIAATPGLRLTNVVTGNPERRAQAVEAYPGIRTPADPSELWERGDFDLVVVATPTDSHAPL